MSQSQKVFLGLPLRVWTRSLPSGGSPFSRLVFLSFRTSPIFPSIQITIPVRSPSPDLLPRGQGQYDLIYRGFLPPHPQLLQTYYNHYSCLFFKLDLGLIALVQLLASVPSRSARTPITLDIQPPADDVKRIHPQGRRRRPS